MSELLRLALASARASGVPERISAVLAGAALAEPDLRAARAAFDEWNSKTGPAGQGEPGILRVYYAACAAKRLQLPAEAAKLFAQVGERAARIGNLLFVRLASEA